MGFMKMGFVSDSRFSEPICVNIVLRTTSDYALLLSLSSPSWAFFFMLTGGGAYILIDVDVQVVCLLLTQSLLHFTCTKIWLCVGFFGIGFRFCVYFCYIFVNPKLYFGSITAFACSSDQVQVQVHVTFFDIRWEFLSYFSLHFNYFYIMFGDRFLVCIVLICSTDFNFFELVTEGEPMV